MVEDNPEGRENTERIKGIYRIYQKNIHVVDHLVYRITLGARQGVPEEMLLEMAKEALAKIDFGEETV